MGYHTVDGISPVAKVPLMISNEHDFPRLVHQYMHTIDQYLTKTTWLSAVGVFASAAGCVTYTGIHGGLSWVSFVWY